MRILTRLIRCASASMVLFFSIAIAALVAGCDNDPTTPEPNGGIIAEFTEFCFGDVDLHNLEVSGRLVLDTYNLPSVAHGGNKLVLGEVSDEVPGSGPMVEFYFPEPLSAVIDPGIASQSGWKVALESVSAERCSTCYTNDGLARIVLLVGSIENVTFEYDPADTLSVYLDHREITR